MDSSDPGEPFPQLIYLTILQIQQQDLMLLSASGLVILLLLVLSALVSGSEVAFFSIGQSEVSELKTSPDAKDIKIIQLLKDPKKLLGVILVLNNLVNVAIVTISAFMVWKITGSTDGNPVAVAVQTVINVFMIVLFGEIIPKIYANQNNLKFARLALPVLSVGQVICMPLVFVLTGMGNFIEKRIRKKGYSVTLEELNHALEITTEEGEEATEEEKDILKGLVNFGTISVKQVMKSRIEIIAIDVEIDYHQLMDKINKSGFSRLPVFRDTIDKIEGVLYIKDLLNKIDEDENYKWQDLIRKGFFVPENKKIDDLLKDFQEKQVHMAIVVDEYGGTSGLITMEDILEEIVGDINDEFDVEEVQTYKKVNASTYIFEGKTQLDDFCEILEVPQEKVDELKGDSESLGGLMLEIFERMPKIGELTHIDHYELKVLSIDPRKIRRIQVKKMETKFENQ